MQNSWNAHYLPNCKFKVLPRKSFLLYGITCLYTCTCSLITSLYYKCQGFCKMMPHYLNMSSSLSMRFKWYWHVMSILSKVMYTRTSCFNLVPYHTHWWEWSHVRVATCNYHTGQAEPVSWRTATVILLNTNFSLYVPSCRRGFGCLDGTKESPFKWTSAKGSSEDS